jgi:hypothetical protein
MRDKGESHRNYYPGYKSQQHIRYYQSIHGIRMQNSSNDKTEQHHRLKKYYENPYPDEQIKGNVLAEHTE